METILTTRQIDCSKLTRAEFINVMTQDLKDARQKYHDIFYPEAYKKHQELNEYHRNSTLKNAIKFAEKKWKTEKRRQQYIEEMMKECEENITNSNSSFFYPISFFDFNVEPIRNGIPDDCILRYDNEEKLGRCYDRIKDNKYFKNAKGWQLIDRHNSRPYVKLILSEELEKEYNGEKETLYRAVTEFYRNCSIQD